MKRFYLLVIIGFFAFSTRAQPVPMKEGKDALLVTLKGDSLWGKAEVDLEYEIVQIRGEQGFRAMDFPRIKSLRLYDEDENHITAYRRYPTSHAQSELLEQVVIGPVHLLRKSKPRAYNNYIGSTMLSSTREVMESQYFFWHQNRLIKVVNFKKQLLSMVKPEEQELVLNFRKAKKIRYHNSHDWALLVDYLNLLREQQQLAYGK
ncbi:MAG: hypothetical protein AAF519_18805 [Bacteroidota bacterium]